MSDHGIPTLAEVEQEAQAQTMAEVGQMDRRVARVCGPALYLAPDPSSPTFRGGTILIGPKHGYDEVQIQVVWRMENPTHAARLFVLTTCVEEPSAESPWADITESYDRKRATKLREPATWATENHLMLTYREVYAPFVGFRLETDPMDTRLMARLWVILVGHGEGGKS